MALLHVKQLYSGDPTADGSRHVVYTVPMGYRVVIKSIYVRSSNSTTGWWVVDISTVEFFTASLPAFGVSSWSGWIVAESAQTIGWASQSGTAPEATISGSIYLI